MTIIENLVHESKEGAFSKNIKQIPNWNLNEAFSYLSEGIMPQFKSKMIESMMCRTLVLVQKSPWDVMERNGYVEGEHFLYFDDAHDLDSTIQGCLAEWDYCEKIIENAYKKSLDENSPQAIYNRYLKRYDI